MLGMPSEAVLAQIGMLADSSAPMVSAVSAEVRRFQRAVGMSTWDVITAHNRCRDPVGTDPKRGLPAWAAAGLGPGDAAGLKKRPWWC